MSVLSKVLAIDGVRSNLRDKQSDAISGLGAMVPTYQAQADQAGATAGQFKPLRTQSAASLYGRYAKGFDGAGLLKKKMLAGLGEGFDRAGAQARAQALATGANPTSALALINAKKAQATSGALTQYGITKQQEDERYAKGAYGVASDMYGRSRGEQNSALGRVGSLYGQQYQMYGDQAGQEEQRANQGRQMVMDLIRTGASVYGASQGSPGAIGGAPASSRGGYMGLTGGHDPVSPYDYGDPSGAAWAPGAGDLGYQSPDPTFGAVQRSASRLPRTNSRIY